MYTVDNQIFLNDCEGLEIEVKTPTVISHISVSENSSLSHSSVGPDNKCA